MLISFHQYSEFVTEYYSTKPQYLRLGQAFWNKFLTHETQKEDRLFYMQDTKKAEEIILTNYVEGCSK